MRARTKPGPPRRPIRISPLLLGTLGACLLAACGGGGGGGLGPPQVPAQVTAPLGSSVEFTVISLEDAELSVAPLPLPPGVEFDLSSGVLRHTPRVEQAGQTLELRFTQRLGGQSATATASIGVSAEPFDGPTRLIGRVLSSADDGPVAGVAVRLPEQGLSATTDGDGRFTFDDVPAGATRLEVDGSAAPSGIFATVFVALNEFLGHPLYPGQANLGAGSLWLPLLEQPAGTVDPLQTTALAAHSGSGVGLEISPGSAYLDGQPYDGEVHLVELDPERAPVALPGEFEPSGLLLVQPSGLTFDPPARLTVPNLDELEPGAEAEIWVVLPETGQLLLGGIAEVSGDGLRLETTKGGVIFGTLHFIAGATPAVDGGNPENGQQRRDPAGALAVEAGGRLGLAAGDLVLEHATAPWRSLGEERGLDLVFSSERARPRPLLNLDLAPAPAGSGAGVVSTRLAVGGVRQPERVFTASAQETARHALQFDASAMPTGLYPVRARFASEYPLSARARDWSGAVLVENGTESPFGPGWGLAGLRRLHLEASSRRLVVTDGAGGAGVFLALEAPPSGPEAELFFLLDASSAVGDGEFAARLQALAAVLADAQAVPADGRVSVCVVQFGEGAVLEVPLTVLDSPATAQSIADTVAAIVRLPASGGSFGGGPQQGAAYDLGLGLVQEQLAGAAADSRRSLLALIGGWPADADAGLVAQAEVLGAGLQAIDALALGRWADLDYLHQLVREGLVWSLPDELGLVELLGRELHLLTRGAAPGEPARLRRLESGEYRLEELDGSWHEFDGQGLHLASQDRAGNRTRYEYDLQGRLVGLVDPVGRASSFTYAGAWIALASDPFGRTISFSRDPDGRLLEVRDVDGTRHGFAYDEQGRLVSETDRRGLVTEFEYGPHGGVQRVLLPDGSERGLSSARNLAFQPDAEQSSKLEPGPAVPSEGLESRFTDGLGRLRRVSTDALGRPTRILDPLGRETLIERGPDGLPRRAQRPGGAVTAFEWNARGQLTELIEGAESTLERRTRWAYADGLLEELSDALDAVTEYEYDSAGNLQLIRNPLGGEARAIHDTRGLVAARWDEAGAEWNYEYDAFGNLVRLIDPEGSTVELERDEAGLVARITEGAGSAVERSTQLLRDDWGRVIGRVDPDGAQWEIERDEEGRIEVLRAPTGEQFTRGWDALGRLASSGHPHRGVVLYGWDAAGNLVWMGRDEDSATGYVYDLADQLVRIEDPAGAAQTIVRDISGEVVWVKDALGRSYKYGYDLLGNLRERTDPLGRVETFEVDPRGLVTERVSLAGATLRYEYDALGRLVELSAPDNLVELDWDPASRLVRISDADSRVDFAYDGLGRRVREETAELGGQPAVVRSYSHDAVGELIAVTGLAGAETSFGRDAMGRLVELDGPGGASVAWVLDELGRPLGELAGNGVSSSYERGLDGALFGLELSSGSDPLLGLDLVYDGNGRLSQLVTDGVSQTFDYDVLGRLIAAGPVAAPEEYSYDTVQNRHRSLHSGEASHDAANQLLADGGALYGHDLDGNLETRKDSASGAETAYSYDTLGQLVKVVRPDGSLITFSYDGLGRRIARNRAGEITRYVFDGPSPVLEFDGAGQLQARFLHAGPLGRPLVIERWGESSYLHADHRGDIRRVTDGGGLLAGSYDYDAWGRELESSGPEGNPFRFAGRPFDPAAGLCSFGDRLYDAELGRFLGRDPAGLAGGAHNPYPYAGNEPVGGAPQFGGRAFGRAADPRALGADLAPGLAPSRANLHGRTRAALEALDGPADLRRGGEGLGAPSESSAAAIADQLAARMGLEATLGAAFDRVFAPHAPRTDAAVADPHLERARGGSAVIELILGAVDPGRP